MKESSPTVPPDPQIAALECAHSLMKQIEEGHKNLMELARATASQIDSRQFRKAASGIELLFALANVHTSQIQNLASMVNAALALR